MYKVSILIVNRYNSTTSLEFLFLKLQIVVFFAILACFAFAMATALPADDLETAQQYYGGWGRHYGGGWGRHYGGWGRHYGGWRGGGYGHYHRHYWG